MDHLLIVDEEAEIRDSLESVLTDESRGGRLSLITREFARNNRRPGEIPMRAKITARIMNMETRTMRMAGTPV